MYFRGKNNRNHTSKHFLSKTTFYIYIYQNNIIIILFTNHIRFN